MQQTYCFYLHKKGLVGKHWTLLVARVGTPLGSGLRSTLLLLLLLQLKSQLLGVRVLQWFNRHSRLGPRFPLGATLIHHRRLHADDVGAQDGEVQQELGAEVVIVGLHALFDLVGFGVEWNLNKEKKKLNTHQNRPGHFKDSDEVAWTFKILHNAWA